MSQSRQLAAIMFTDIVGYSALMGRDEKEAFRLLDQSREIQKPIIEEFNGQWIKELGDGAIASFNSASDALVAGMKIQESCRTNEDLDLKIGIHLGEVVFENNDVFGDGVNIASRIETLGAPGSVLLSKSIRDQVKNKSEFKLVSLGRFEFKNISDPIEVFAVANPGFVVPKREKMQGKLKPAAPKSGLLKWILGIAVLLAIAFTIWASLSQKNTSTTGNEKSIAVLAFADMSPAKDQEYFGDGLSENLIDLLAKVQTIKVIGRTSSFAFKGKNEDLRSIGKKLGVNHIVEGSVQKDGNKLRITAQLIRAFDGFHLWSDQYDKELKDIFDIQDEISQAILNSIKIKLLDKEVEDVFKKYTDNVEAHELHFNARYHINKFTPDGFLKAIEYLDSAITKDPEYAIAFADKAFCYMNLRDFGWLPTEQSESLAREAAARAFKLDKEIAESHLAVGRIKLHWDWKIDEAAANFRNALKITNSAQGHVQLGMCLVLLGKNQEALEHTKKAEILDPLSILNLYYLTTMPMYIGEHETTLAYGKKMIELEPQAFSGYFRAGLGYLGLGQYEDAVANFEIMVKKAPGVWTTGFLAVAYAIKGDQPKAEELLRRMEEIVIEESIEHNSIIGNVYLALGDKEKAYAYYNKALENGEGPMLWVKPVIQLCPECLDDPEFQQILDRIGVHY